MKEHNFWVPTAQTTLKSELQRTQNQENKISTNSGAARILACTDLGTQTLFFPAAAASSCCRSAPPRSAARSACPTSGEHAPATGDRPDTGDSPRQPPRCRRCRSAPPRSAAPAAAAAAPRPRAPPPAAPPRRPSPPPPTTPASSPSRRRNLQTALARCRRFVSMAAHSADSTPATPPAAAAAAPLQRRPSPRQPPPPARRRSCGRVGNANDRGRRRRTIHR